MSRQENNNSQSDLADLRGARFVQTSESEDGQRLAQGKLKRITQGMGMIKAVRKYENPIEFPESHKLWLDTNRRPDIADPDDQATFNRLHPIPFLRQIPADQIDRSLPEKLLDEAEGILSWGVAGAVEWNKNGLQPPPEIVDAAKEWHDEVDQLKRFLDDRCVEGPNFSARASTLYAAYLNWVVTAGEKSPMSQTKFGRRMTAKGFCREGNDPVMYRGIGLRAE
jgi:putative DNA primase/helicase